MIKDKNTFKDVFDKDICVGDKVVLLVKRYGFCGLDDAYLRPCIYKGKTRYGHTFYDISNRHMCSHAYRDPQAVRIHKKGGK